MSKPRTFATIRRSLIRRLDNQPDDVLKGLRNELWQRLIVRQFMRGYGVDYVASDQPNWGTVEKVEAAMRSQIRKRGGLR